MADISEEFLKVSGIKTDEPRPLIMQETVSEATLQAELEKAKRLDHDVTVGSLLSKAAQEEHIYSLGMRNSYRFDDIPKNPVDELTPEMSDMLTEDLNDPRAVEDVFRAAQDVSFDYAMKMADDYRLTAKNVQDLRDAGWLGTTATFLAAMFDPIELATIGATTAAVGAVTGGVGGVATGAAQLGTRAYRVGRAVKYGAGLGAAEATAFESIRAKLKYDVDGGDVMLAGLIGGGIGGGLGGVGATFRRQATMHELTQRVALGDELTPEERAFYDFNNGDAQTQRVMDRIAERGDLEDVEGTPLDGEVEVEQARVTPVGELEAEEARQTSKQLGGSFLAPLRKRLSVVNRLKNSDNGFSRVGSDRLGLNSSGNVDRTVVDPPASEIKTMLEMRYRKKFAETMYANRRKWRKRTGGNYADFNIAVSRAIRSGALDVADPDVRAVAQDVMKAQRELGNEAIRYNVGGFTPGILDGQPNYLPRLFADDRVRTIRQKYGQDTERFVSELVEKAIRNGQPDIETRMSADDIGDMARGYAKTILSPAYHRGHRSLEFTVEDLRKSLEAEQIDGIQIERIIDEMTRTTGVKGHKRARFRVALDESTVIDVRTPDGGVEQLRFSDLLEEDIENLHNAYVFQMSSAIGLARNGINTNDVSSSFDNFIAKVRQEAADINQNPNDLEEEIKALEFMYDTITGRLAFKDGQPTGDTRTWLRRLREGSFILNMGMSGMAAIMELTNVLMEYSVPVLFKTLPQYRKLMQLAQDGNLSSPLLRELTSITGLGADVITGKFTRASRFEGDSMEIPEDSNFTWWDEKLGQGREIMSLASGLSPVTAILRQMSHLNFANAWEMAARQNRNPFSDIKMEQLGITPQMAERIRTQIRNKATVRDGQLETLNADDWDDKEAFDVFSIALFRDATQNVQEVNIGSVNPLLRGEWGKSLFQFMSFPMAAMEQQGMRLGVRAFNGDATSVFKIITAATFAGSLLYTARVYLNAEGRSDKEEYIKRMMSPERLAQGAISQIGATSTFAMIMDVTTGAMDGNTYAITPASLSMMQAVMATGKAAFEGDMTEAEYRKMLRLLPYSSLYGVRSMLNYASNEMAN